LPDLPTSLRYIVLNDTPLPEFNRLPDNFNLLTPSVQNVLRRKLRPIQVNPNQGGKRKRITRKRRTK
jgi:hypothetical protein